VAQQTDGFEQEVVEIERIRPAEFLIIEFEDLAEPGHLGIGGGLVEVLGTLLVILGVADARQGRAVLHELVVQAEFLVDLLDQDDLVVSIIDLKFAGKAGANGAERRSIATQQADTEAVEGADVRSSVRDAAREQIQDAFAHLTGGLVGEGDGEDGRAENSM